MATVNPTDATAYSGSIGLPLPSTDVAILDDAGNEVPLGERGEVGIRGPQVMLGYWRKPEETRQSMTADGYFRTGDIGIMDEQGYTRIVDRKKDMIAVSGFKVYPNEVEAAVAQHPGVLECAAIGVPDEHSGEAVKVFVVKKDPSLTEEQVQQWCKDKLTGYKRPRYVEFRDELPKSNVGKILRRELRPDAEAAAKRGLSRARVQSCLSRCGAIISCRAWPMAALPATTRPPIGQESRLCMSEHMPPDSRTSSVPAATSQGASPISQ